jgi:uncharacterized protein YggE
VRITYPLERKVFVIAAALVGALTVLGVLVTGCGDGGSQGVTQGPIASGSLVDTIVVSGTGETTTLPDKATIRVSVETDGTTSAQALDRNASEMQQVLDRLRAEGVADDKIETASVVVYPNRYYDPATGREKTTGYRAQNTVTVTFDDLNIIGDIFAAMTEAGADSVYGPNWQLSDDNPAVATALSRALTNARIKAEAIAADQGVRLGDAIIISESSASQVYPVYDTRMEFAAGDDGSVTAPPISPQNIEVKASVTVTYRMTR